MSSPVTALTGMFMLMWAWLGFNCGSTFRISPEYWKVCALVAVTTLNGAIGGGLLGLTLSMLMKKGKVSVDFVINSTLGGLVSVTGGCSVYSPSEALAIGAIGGAIAIGACEALVIIQIDDPVGAVPVHLCAGLWGTLAVGLFAQDNMFNFTNGLSGLFHNGGFRFVGINMLGAVVMMTWAGTLTFIILFTLDKIMGIRMSQEHEELGADFVDHDIRSFDITNKLDKVFRDVDQQDSTALIEALAELIAEVKQKPIGKSRSLHLISTSPSVGPLTLPKVSFIAAARKVAVVSAFTNSASKAKEIKENGDVTVEPMSIGSLHDRMSHPNTVVTTLDFPTPSYSHYRPSMTDLNNYLADRQYVPPIRNRKRYVISANRRDTVQLGTRPWSTMDRRQHSLRPRENRSWSEDRMP